MLPELDLTHWMQICPQVTSKRRFLFANVKHNYNDPYIKSRDHREKSIIVAAKNCNNS